MQAGPGRAGSTGDLAGGLVGVEIGALIGAIHRSQGVTLLAGPQVTAFEGAERLEAVVTDDGGRVACDYIHNFWSDQYEHTDLRSLAQ